MQHTAPVPKCLRIKCRSSWDSNTGLSNSCRLLLSLSYMCLPPLVLKARAPNDGSAFCIGFSRLEVPEQTLGGIPLGLGMVMKINFFEFSCTCVHSILLYIYIV